jgi:hypothetical protein
MAEYFEISGILLWFSILTRRSFLTILHQLSDNESKSKAAIPGLKLTVHPSGLQPATLSVRDQPYRDPWRPPKHEQASEPGERVNASDCSLHVI